ncbi:hypothetical protein [Streptomyces sp. SPB074]|uniref:hypothetical protein n=1 Tax=Streptomyces sp. (strain SPB074) TaxID=465543 RepID=UPI00017F1D58|nr:hypothetical protein [Streptomyces sp. SPB074]EDY45898.2 conserved hypothetical protein [Streptomyces sp. SPB074]
MKRQRTVTACAALVAASVLVAGCGGDDGGSDKAPKNEIAGAEKTASPKPSPSASASKSTASEEGAPDLSLPKDLKVVTDWEVPKGAEEAAALRDAVNALTGQVRAIARQDVDDPAYLFYSYPASNARQWMQTDVKTHVQKKSSVTGTRTLSKQSVQIVRPHATAVVTFCVDDHEYAAKHLDTGKVINDSDDATNYIKYEWGMTTTGKDGHWRAKEIRGVTAAKECM